MINDDSSVNNHILSWVNLEREATMGQSCLYGFEQIGPSSFIEQTLNYLDEAYFPMEEGMQSAKILEKIEIYLDKELGKRLKRITRKDIVKNEEGEKLIKLLLFLCVQSKQKNHFINRIMSLPENIQDRLMQDIQEISEGLENVLQLKEILKQMELLEEENQNFKIQIKLMRQNEAKFERCLRDWEEEVHRQSIEIEAYKKQKEKVIESLQLIDLEDYTNIFRKLQQQNNYLNYSVQEYEEKNSLLNESCEQMKKQIKENSTVIAQLNQQIMKVKEMYSNLKLQKSYFEQTCDATRSFGRVLEFNVQHRRNQFYKHLRTSRRSRTGSDYQNDVQNMKEIIPQSLKETSIELEQLRMYNSQIMQKLQGCYKNINMMNIESNRTKEKNKQLLKQVKFYKKQVKDIKTLHRELEIKFQNGDL